jgi:hypothetical protein
MTVNCPLLDWQLNLVLLSTVVEVGMVVDEPDGTVVDEPDGIVGTTT